MKNIDYFIKKYLENRPMFHAFIRPQEAMLFQKYSKLLKHPVVDFGCSDGFFAKTVFGKGKIDVGLDLKNSRADEAMREKVYKKVAFYDGMAIPYPNNYFQTVISNCVLEHIPNLNQSLKEICRVLKPGGFFLTTVITDKWESDLLGGKIFGNFYIGFMRKAQQHFNLFSENKWQKTFEKTGFKIKEKAGYLSQSSTRYNEVFHYLSLTSLISYKLCGKWILYPNMFNSSTIINLIKKNIGQTVEINQSAAIFFVLKKRKYAFCNL